MKRTIFLFLFLAVLLFIKFSTGFYFMGLSNLPSHNMSHTMTKEYIWYCLPHKPGDQPLPIEKAKFIKDYKVLYIGKPNEKVIYLTFDDPSKNAKMGAILDTLKENNVKAAFFMVEGYIRKNPGMIRRMVEEGHIVCNHTSHHINISRIMDFKKFKEELEGVENVFEEATGFKLAKFFRPPQGRFSELTLKYASLLGYTTTFWSFCYHDWEISNQSGEYQALKKILDETHPGEIVMLHTQSSTNVKILQDLINRWKEMGYTFGSLESLVNG